MAFYELKLRRDGNAWLVSAPDFPEVTTYGDSKDEALRWGLDAVLQAIAGRIADNEDIPAPHSEARTKGAFVEVPLLVQMKVELYAQLRAQGKSRADLMRLLGTHREQIDRLFRLDHNSRLDQLEAAFRVLGTQVRVEVLPAEAA